MIFQDVFQYFTIWDGIESGLYYAIVGFYVLIFFYFLLMRFRVSKKLYWFYFSILFLFLAAGRGFFIVYYFYAPELLEPYGPMTGLELVGLLMILYRLATFSTWLAIACLMGVFGTLIVPHVSDIAETKDNESKIKVFLRNNNVRILLKICLIVIPIVVSILALTLPDSLFMDPDFNDPPYNADIDIIPIFGYPAGRFVLNFLLLPIMVIVIPFLFVYLALKTFGVLRRSYALNAIGFFIYFSGRIAQGLLESFGFPHVEAILPPLLILLSLLIIVIANNYEQLR